MLRTIAIDSNIFRDRDFINYLILYKGKLRIFVPTIVQMEAGFFHLIKGNTWEDFVLHMQEFGGECVGWDQVSIQDVIVNAYNARQKLPFRQHIRDFIIGTECETLGCDLVTSNVDHFSWVKKITVKSPQDFVSWFEGILGTSSQGAT
jgi:predicted nucleic acid-binding protein